MSELNDALARLSISEKEGDLYDIDSSFRIIMKHLLLEESERIYLVEMLLERGILDVALYVLKCQDKFCESTVVQVPRIIAELAKTEIGRKTCCEASLVEQILNLLESKSSELVLHAARALGNICYENENAQFLMKSKNYIDKILQLFKGHLDSGIVLENLPSITSGCLLNLIYTCKELHVQALEGGILDLLWLYLIKFCDNEEVVVHCITALSCLAETETGRKQILSSSIIPLLLKRFDEPINKDIMDSLFEAFGNLCEDDSAKFKLAEMGLCHKLVELVKEHINCSYDAEEKLHIFKTVPGLVILMLTGDSSMEFLYEGGKGLIYNEILAWIESQNKDLCIAGILALGNFARRDSHCIQMTSTGVGELLFSLLQKNCKKDDDVRTQHAILSTMRNLAIPACNKLLLNKLGVVDILFSMADIETFPVVFKLLGTLRMLLDKQEQIAIEIGGNEVFIEQLMVWSSNNCHPGIKGEATRILASLVKNSCSSSVMKMLIEKNAFPHIVSLLESEHVIMQNEALIALTLMMKCCTVEVEKVIEASKLCEAIISVLNRNSHIVEVTQNMLTLISVLMKSEKSMCLLRQQVGLQVELQALKTNDERILKAQQEILLQMENFC